METYLSSFIIHVPLKGGLVYNHDKFKRETGIRIDVFIYLFVLTNNPPILLQCCSLNVFLSDPIIRLKINK